MLSEGINNRYKASNRPYYVETAQLWKVDIPGWGIEEGDLLYVASEYARAGLIFPYSTSYTKDRHGHAHYFEGVLEALLGDPEGFSIEGFEQYYSAQEKEMRNKVQVKLRKQDIQPQEG